MRAKIATKHRTCRAVSKQRNDRPERQAFETELTTDASLRDTVGTGEGIAQRSDPQRTPQGRIESQAGGGKGWGKEMLTDSIDGYRLFKQNCSSCHAINHKVIGPPLKGKRKKWADTEHQLYEYLRNPAQYSRDYPSELIRSAQKASNYAAKTGSSLTDAEFDAIFDFIEHSLVDEISKETAIGINPASIKTIWNEKFNNTNLATKEFEERLAHIHNTCDQWILDYYVNNLDKRLSTLDSTVAQNRDSKYPESEVLDRFWEFAKRGDGRVEADNRYAEFLKGYYHRQAKMEAEAIHLVRKKYDAENMRKLQEAQGKQNEHLTKEAERISENWQQEFKTNLKEAYRQLGYPEPVVPRGRATNNAIVTTPGWKNVDQYVAESVTKRETLDYTNKDGNRAVIKYEAITLQVANAEEFDRVLVYMLPDNLYSFQRMNQNGNAYSEKLNELFEYDVMCIGFKGDESFIHHIRSAEAKDHGSVTLSHIASTELEKLLYTVKDYSVQSNLKEDLAYQRFNVNEQKRVEKRMVKEQLRNEMFSVVFPCDSRKLGAYTTFE
jgi:cytochrome c551/c552